MIEINKDGGGTGIQPIDEMGEIINDLSKEISARDVHRAAVEDVPFDRSGTLCIDP